MILNRTKPASNPNIFWIYPRSPNPYLQKLNLATIYANYRRQTSMLWLAVWRFVYHDAISWKIYFDVDNSKEHFENECLNDLNNNNMCISKICINHYKEIRNEPRNQCICIIKNGCFSMNSVRSSIISSRMKITT